MWRRRQELASLDLDVLLVSFEPLERVLLYADETEFGWPVLADEGHEIYALYGLVRTSFAKAWLSPRTVGYYLRAAFRGKRLHRPTGDTLQLGGDFLIDPAGRVVFAFRSAEPADRPSVERILSARSAGSRG